MTMEHMAERAEIRCDSIRLLSCARNFRRLHQLDIRDGEAFPTVQCMAMIELSAMLADLLQKEGPFDLIDEPEWRFKLVPRSDSQSSQSAWIEGYYQFIDRMRSIAIHIGFRRLPVLPIRYIIDKEREQMADWCFAAARVKGQLEESLELVDDDD